MGAPPTHASTSFGCGKTLADARAEVHARERRSPRSMQGSDTRTRGSWLAGFGTARGAGPPLTPDDRWVAGHSFKKLEHEAALPDPGHRTRVTSCGSRVSCDRTAVPRRSSSLGHARRVGRPRLNDVDADLGARRYRLPRGDRSRLSLCCDRLGPASLARTAWATCSTLTGSLALTGDRK